MKKIIPVLVISVLVLGTTLLWMTNSKFTMPLAEIVQFVVIILIVGFAVYLAVNRLRSVRRGEPAEDELSKKILQKASAFSFYTSLYLWVAMIYINDHTKLDTGVLIGIGILGMAVIWVVLVIFFKIRGIKHE
jgi:uncharacterized membrane protein YhaH (DUF805 family)